MKADRDERRIWKEFAEFLEAQPASPSAAADESVLKRVARDLRPSRWMVYSKLTLVQVAAGLSTMTICPQFGLGFGRHHEFLHALHSATPPIIFYLLCGVFFVILGGMLGGLVLNRAEVRTTARSRPAYFAAYSVLAYLALIFSGPEVFAAGSLSWMPGALLGSVFGFEGGTWLRKAMA